ncbi:hypothetical protein [Zhihengliuella flava]|uniref:Uncharacterized protein n=1 Tax=Zhihengliuella flava TaxID=1285193 RepID=A0A931GEM5_9MICC|nr:hypothetical protein [Zhihengliuella flava]MBG6084558.1 hypothetical protein [Zhihengliuella flava]
MGNGWDELVTQTGQAVEGVRQARDQLHLARLRVDWRSTAGAAFQGALQHALMRTYALLDDAERAHAAALAGRQRAAENPFYEQPSPHGVEHIGARMGML